MGKAFLGLLTVTGSRDWCRPLSRTLTHIRVSCPAGTGSLEPQQPLQAFASGDRFLAPALCPS